MSHAFALCVGHDLQCLLSSGICQGPFLFLSVSVKYNWLINHKTFQRLGKLEGAIFHLKGIQRQFSFCASGSLLLASKKNDNSNYHFCWFLLLPQWHQHQIQEPFVQFSWISDLQFFQHCSYPLKTEKLKFMLRHKIYYFRFAAAIDCSHVLSKGEKVFVSFILRNRSFCIRSFCITIAPLDEIDWGFYRLQLVENLSYSQVNSSALKICSLSVVWSTSLWPSYICMLN